MYKRQASVAVWCNTIDFHLRSGLAGCQEAGKPATAVGAGRLIESDVTRGEPRHPPIRIARGSPMTATDQAGRRENGLCGIVIDTKDSG